MAKYVMSMSYAPKLDAVFAGACRQTIRKGDKYRVGDEILIHEWQGAPYRSKWGRRIRVRVWHVAFVRLLEAGIMRPLGIVPRPWDAEDMLAQQDCIDPPTGEALRGVLKSLNGPKWEGEYQVIRWKVIE